MKTAMNKLKPNLYRRRFNMLTFVWLLKINANFCRFPFPLMFNLYFRRFVNKDFFLLLLLITDYAYFQKILNFIINILIFVYNIYAYNINLIKYYQFKI